jgi:hypothetical protein
MTEHEVRTSVLVHAEAVRPALPTGLQLGTHAAAICAKLTRKELELIARPRVADWLYWADLGGTAARLRAKHAAPLEQPSGLEAS